MRRRAVVFVALALFLAGAVYAESSDAPAEATPEQSMCLPDAAGAELAAEWSEEFVPGKIVEAGIVPLIGPCPVRRDCTGPAGNGNTCSTNPANCGVTGIGSSYDTGQKACLLAGGGTFYCPTGKTIHIKRANCDQCSCCSGPPPVCVCPIDCGEVLRWGCG
ncbi:MAG: hypothetical protein GY719_09560 [bacterium]|nr:hypothetical protein [bacterium]